MTPPVETPGALTPERVLDAAEDTLRRYGPAKTTVVDVARALGVSHGSVYRHFPSKAALRDAVTARWLARVCAPLDELAESDAPAPERLRRWLDTLVAAKRKRHREEPELFATYLGLAEHPDTVIADHVRHLLDQLERIVGDGVAAGEMTAADVPAAARAVFDATGRFHNPAHAGDWERPSIDAEYEGVVALVMAGLRVADAPKPASARASGRAARGRRPSRAAR